MKSFRKRSRYSRVSNDKKHLLVDLVINKQFKLCKATQLLGIKYSTAKTVMRLFRRENKIFRKDIEEERSLKMILQNLHYKSDPKHKLFLVSN